MDAQFQLWSDQNGALLTGIIMSSFLKYGWCSLILILALSTHAYSQGQPCSKQDLEEYHSVIREIINEATTDLYCEAAADKIISEWRGIFGRNPSDPNFNECDMWYRIGNELQEHNDCKREE